MWYTTPENKSTKSLVPQSPRLPKTKLCDGGQGKMKLDFCFTLSGVQ